MTTLLRLHGRQATIADKEKVFDPEEDQDNNEIWNHNHSLPIKN